ncbi:hypothetical protein K490DRAFT_52865 [Saccharata proteae CBS 121410]|uniref:Uncharacterized protein n=1 Tax=Saccharata proteae CBS 121410 TaxID=1314787 RepID=A0A9P4LZZ9_9PEZI|nr:hypothetical protein K490DRAFT_52865 [Saccharata proteae CBS 121410]
MPQYSIEQYLDVAQTSNAENVQPSVAKKTAPASGKLKKITRKILPIRAMDTDELQAPPAPDGTKAIASQSRNHVIDPQKPPEAPTQRRNHATEEPDQIFDDSLSPGAQRASRHHGLQAENDAAVAQKKLIGKAKSQHDDASMGEPENDREGTPVDVTNEYQMEKRKRNPPHNNSDAVAGEEHEIESPSAVDKDTQDATERPRKIVRRFINEKAPSRSQPHPQVVISHSKNKETSRSGRRAPSPHQTPASNSDEPKPPSVEEQPIQEEDEDDEEEGSDINNYVFSDDDDDDISISRGQQLYGQKTVIEEIWTSKKATIVQIRRDNQLHVKSEYAKDISERCKQLLSALRGDDHQPDEITSLVKEEVANIGTILKYLDLEDREERRKHLFENIYAFVFPNLFRIIIDMVETFTCGRDENDQDVDPKALRIVIDHVKNTCDFYERVRNAKFTPPPGLGIVRPIMRMITPLKEVLRVLKTELKDGQRREQRALERAERDRVQQQKLAEEAAREEAERRIKQTEWDWTSLENDRLWHEPDDRRRQQLRERFKSIHSLAASDVDANGKRFDRVDVFNARRERSGRTSPPLDPSEWTLDQIEALLECMDFYGQSAPRTSK